MPLINHKHSFQPSTTPVEMMDTEQEAMFLGRAYKVQHGYVAMRHSSQQLKYRGQTYNA